MNLNFRKRKCVRGNKVALKGLCSLLSCQSLGLAGVQFEKLFGLAKMVTLLWQNLQFPGSY